MKDDIISAYLRGEAAGFARILRIRARELAQIRERMEATIREIKQAADSLVDDAIQAEEYGVNADHLACPRCWIFDPEETGYLTSVPSRLDFLSTFNCQRCGEKYEIMT